MGLINLYDTISNEKKVVQGNGKLKELLPNYNLDNCEIIKAGQKLTKDYEVKQDDVLLLRVLPKGMSALLITTLVVTGVALLAGATLGAVMLVKQKKNKEEMEKAQRDAANLAQSVDTKPYLKGAKNKNALGSLMPYQVGEIYNTPMTLTDGFIEIGGTNGKDQYFNFNFNLGYGDLVVKKILIGDEVILNNASGIAEGEHDFNSTSPYYDAENYVELRQAGNDFTQNTKFNKKVVLTQDGAELKHDYGDEAGTEIIRQVADNTKTLEVCITFNGLRQYDESLSTWVARTATVRPYWSNDGGTTWNEFYFSGMNNNTIEINSKETIRFVATKTFSPAEVMEADESGNLTAKEILLKVVKTTPKLESNSNEDCYLQYYQSFCYDPKTSDLTQLTDCKVIEEFFKNKLTRLAVHVKATENTTDTLDEFHVIASAKAPIWNGTTWGEKAATNNPAAIIYEILTSDKHKPSQMTTEDFDADDLGALYEYCEEMGYTSNAIITSQIKKLDIIDNILQTVNAVMYRQDGLLRFAIDTLEESPVALINAENIKNITYTKELKRKPNGIKVTYTNEKTWQIDTFYLVIDPVTKALRDYRTDDDTLTELSLEYVTNYEHASKIALRNLKELILQPRVITAGVGNVGDRYPLFSTVLLQYKEFRQGLGSGTIHRIIYDNNGDIAGLEISDLMKFNNSTSAHYGVVIYAVSELGSQLYYKTITFTKEKAILNTTNGLLNTIGGLLGVIKPGTIATRTIYFDEPIEVTDSAILPQLLNSISVGILDNDGEFTKVTHTMKITNIEPDGNGSFTLTLKDYNPSIYDAGAIPSYKSNITPAARVAKAIPSNPNTNSDILTNDAKAVIYEETGLSRLDSVDITEVNTDTGEVTIKADLIKGAKGVFDEISSIGGTFNEATVEGNLKSSEAIFNRDIFQPCIAFTQLIQTGTPMELDLSSTSAATIKTQLESLFTNARAGTYIYLDYADRTYKRLYIFITSYDETNKKITSAAKASYYLQKYKDYDSNMVFYEIGDVAGVNTNRLILAESLTTGTISKYTSTTYSNKLLFNYAMYECGINGSMFVGSTIESRLGYQFYRPSYQYRNSYALTNQQGELYNYINMLGVGTEPRLCCVRRENYANYDVATVWRNGDAYYINITGVIKIEVAKDSTASSGIAYFYI